MTLEAAGIVAKDVGETLVASRRCQFGSRAELRAVLEDVAQQIPDDCVAGPAFCIFQFISSVKDGYEGEAGFPVKRPLGGPGFTSRVLPAMQVLSLVHHGPLERLRETTSRLYRSAAQQGIISDECMREVYLDADNPEGNAIEVQFVVHDWVRLLERHARRVLGEDAGTDIMRGGEGLACEVGLDERFAWVKGAVQRLEGAADAQQAYDCLSSCAHVFPPSQIDKLRAVYARARSEGAEPLAAVDAVLDFMAVDPGWGERPRREGRVIYHSKRPRDPKAFEAATTPAEKARAYCFCPIIRERLDAGMPPAFCNCGAGWFRQQWEGATGRPVQIEIVESLLRGDERCTFAVRLPEDL